MESEKQPIASPWMDAKQAAAYLGIHKETLLYIARKNLIPAGSVGRAWRFNCADLDEAIRKGIKVVRRGKKP